MQRWENNSTSVAFSLVLLRRRSGALSISRRLKPFPVFPISVAACPSGRLPQGAYCSPTLSSSLTALLVAAQWSLSVLSKTQKRIWGKRAQLHLVIDASATVQSSGEKVIVYPLTWDSWSSAMALNDLIGGSLVLQSPPTCSHCISLRLSCHSVSTFPSVFLFPKQMAALHSWGLNDDSAQ